MSQEKITRGKQIAKELADIARQLSDVEARELLGSGALDDLLTSILDPSEVSNYSSIAEFLLANKARASILALVRYAITHNYSFKVTKDGASGYVSPYHAQFFEDGVILTQGSDPFMGLISLYRNGKLSFAVAARDMRPGEQIGPEDFEFVELDDIRKVQGQIPLAQISKLDEPIKKLETLLEAKDNDEAKYQQLLQDYPWILGAQYKTFQRHQNLDEENIPDFTGIRVHDAYRDILEIKPPFMKLFLKGGNFSSQFNNAWNQAERYLNFAQEEKDYLRRKKLNFDNPKCYLILGFNLSDEEIHKIRIKHKMNPSIELRTYNDLLAWMKSTVDLVRDLKSQDTLNQAVQTDDLDINGR